MKKTTERAEAQKALDNMNNQIETRGGITPTQLQEVAYEAVKLVWGGEFHSNTLTDLLYQAICAPGMDERELVAELLMVCMAMGQQYVFDVYEAAVDAVRESLETTARGLGEAYQC